MHVMLSIYQLLHMYMPHNRSSRLPASLNI